MIGRARMTEHALKTAHASIVIYLHAVVTLIVNTMFCSQASRESVEKFKAIYYTLSVNRTAPCYITSMCHAVLIDWRVSTSRFGLLD